jgi:hypothetical protein
MKTRSLARQSRSASRTARAMVLTVAAASTACYRYVPSAGSDLQVGEEVRVRLTSNGSVDLQSLVGTDVVAIDGRVTAKSDSGYALAIGGTTKRAGAAAVWSGEPVTVPRNAIAAVEHRVLNKKKTLLMSALGVAGAALMAVVVSAVSGSGSSGPDGGTTPP